MPGSELIDFSHTPDANGHFGRFGGRFVAETLIGPLEELAAAYDAARVDPAFIEAFENDLAHYVGRPSPIY
ncbi:MAG: tryptophan synthase subunit beta, partial [Lysobacter sp.]|nr:tryptophan synthase subunit beta [Lysobacter sp.]